MICALCGGPATWTSPTGHHFCEACRDAYRVVDDDDLEEVDPLAGKPGGSWILDRPQTVNAIWGHGDEVAWAQGEAMMIVGSDGTGKTVLAHNLILRMIGLDSSLLLGLPVLPRKRVLYLAQDRPMQAARAFRRLVGLMDRADLDAALKVVDWPLGPLDNDPRLLLEVAERNEADTVMVDSLKDVVNEPSSERSGQAIKQAYQIAIAGGVETAILHHDRKQAQDSRPRRLLKLADVYGSRLAVAGCGSVIALNGTSGDPVIELRHLKQPAGEVGPLKVVFNFETGELNLYQGGDLLQILAAAKDGLTVQDAARILYETSTPSNSERERARRKLKTLVTRGSSFPRFSGHISCGTYGP
jgi:replicative DNA helicase